MIEPKRKSIEEIFNSSEARLIVPIYQRKYERWIIQVEDLLTDISETMNHDNNKLFLWNFIFDVSNNKEYSIVDGQQRITTIAIALIAARQKAKDINDYSLVNKLQSDLSFMDVVWQVQWNRIKVSSSIENIFNYIIKDDWNWDFPDIINNVGIKRQKIKIKQIYDEIFDFIKEYDISTLRKFVKALKEAYVILLQFDDQNDVYDIFERTNARGMDLNISDLLKNFIFSQWVENYESFREEIYNNSEWTLPRLLKYFWISRKGYVITKDLYRNLKIYCNEIGIENFVKELVYFSKYYKAINDANENDIKQWLIDSWIQDINSNEWYLWEVISVFQALNLFNVKQVIPLVFAVFESYKRVWNHGNLKQLLKLLNSLEKYHFNNNIITNRVWNEVEKLYAQRSQKIYNTDVFNIEIDLFIQELRKKRAMKSEFIARFKEMSYEDGVGLIAYVFDRINNVGLKWAQKINIFYLDKTLQKRNLNIEHILAQNNRQNLNLSREEKEAIDNIGNLLVISRHTNSTLGAKSVEDKLVILQQPEYSGWLRYLKDFIQFYNTVKPNWGKKEIEERAEKMAILAYDVIWNF